VGGAPAGTTFSPTAPPWSSGSATSTLKVPGSAAVGSYTLTIAATDGAGRSHSASATLNVSGAAKGTANIIGSVYSAGVNVSGATVTALENGSVVAATTTDAKGAFTITGLAQGTCTLTVSAPGYADNTVSVMVFNGNWTKIGIPLTR
jgi:hypothetical protein